MIQVYPVRPGQARGDPGGDPRRRLRAAADGEPRRPTRCYWQLIERLRAADRRAGAAQHLVQRERADRAPPAEALDCFLRTRDGRAGRSGPIVLEKRRREPRCPASSVFNRSYHPDPGRDRPAPDRPRRGPRRPPRLGGDGRGGPAGADRAGGWRAQVARRSDARIGTASPILRAAGTRRSKARFAGRAANYLRYFAPPLPAAAARAPARRGDEPDRSADHRARRARAGRGAGGRRSSSSARTCSPRWRACSRTSGASG